MTYSLMDLKKQPRTNLKIEDKMTLSKYMYEQIAGGFDNQLPISAICDAKCFFCSNEMNPFKILREKFREIEDVKMGVALLNPNAPEIRISDSMPGRISEGEALLHPKIFTILDIIRKRCSRSVIQVTTHGTKLTEEFLIECLKYKPMKFTVSYHSNDQENWCKIFGSTKEKFKNSQNCFALMKKYNFIFDVNIVPLPTLVGYDDLENTIKFLSQYLKSIVIYAPGYSQLVTKEIKKNLHYNATEMSDFFIKMRKKYTIDIGWLLDPATPMFFTPLQYMMNTHHSNYKNPLWLFAESVYKEGSKIINDHLPNVPNNHHVTCVKNKTYGGNIIVAGLLQTNDFGMAIEETLKDKKDIDLFILPSTPFDKFGNDLTQNNFNNLYEKYKIPVWIYKTGDARHVD